MTKTRIRIPFVMTAFASWQGLRLSIQEINFKRLLFPIIIRSSPNQLGISIQIFGRNTAMEMSILKYLILATSLTEIDYISMERQQRISIQRQISQ